MLGQCDDDDDGGGGGGSHARRKDKVPALPRWHLLMSRCHPSGLTEAALNFSLSMFPSPLH